MYCCHVHTLVDSLHNDDDDNELVSRISVHQLVQSVDKNVFSQYLSFRNQFAMYSNNAKQLDLFQFIHFIIKFRCRHCDILCQRHKFKLARRVSTQQHNLARRIGFKTFVIEVEVLRAQRFYPEASIPFD